MKTFIRGGGDEGRVRARVTWPGCKEARWERAFRVEEKVAFTEAEGLKVAAGALTAVQC